MGQATACLMIMQHQIARSRLHQNIQAAPTASGRSRIINAPWLHPTDMQ